MSPEIGTSSFKDYALYDMLQANPKEAASIKKAAKLYYDAMLCIANHTMVSYFVAF